MNCLDIYRKLLLKIFYEMLPESYCKDGGIKKLKTKIHNTIPIIHISLYAQNNNMRPHNGYK